MKKLLFLVLTIALVLGAMPVMAAEPVTENYGDLTLSSPWQTTHWDVVWDLT